MFTPLCGSAMNNDVTVFVASVKYRPAIIAPITPEPPNASEVLHPTIIKNVTFQTDNNMSKN